MFEIRPILAAMAIGVISTVLGSSAVRAADPAVPATNGGQAKDVKVSGADSEPQLPKLSAAEIVDRHVAARGGAQAWKLVQTMQLSGKMEAGKGDNIARARKVSQAGRKPGGKATSADVAASNIDLASTKQVLLPFDLDLGRPNRMRLEISFDGKTAVQVFDGEHGWKYRPFLHRKDAEPFTAEEANTEASRGDLDGPLIDYAAKGTQVELEGGDAVDGQPAYRLKVTSKSGSVRHVWIDATSYLDVKVEGVPRRMDGKTHPVFVYQRDFRAVQGVVIPFVMETVVEGYGDSHKLLVDKAAINPVFDDAVFSKPHA